MSQSKGLDRRERESPSLVRRTAGHLRAAIFLSLITAGVYGAIGWGMFAASPDYIDHLQFARQLYESGRPPVPHFLFHLLVAGLFDTRLVHSFVSGGRLVIVGCYLVLPVAVYVFLWTLFRNSRLDRPWILFSAALATLLAQPITLHQAYAVGFFWPEPYHTPTFTLLKPLALAGFAGTVWYLSQRAPDWRLTVLLALTTVAGGLSKPSFLICLLPAAALLACYRLFRRLPICWSGLLIGLYLPAALVLGWQAYATYSGHGAGDYQDSIEWAPFRVMSHWASGLATKFLLSVAFPLVVTVTYWRQVLRDQILQLSWLCFLFGALYSYGFSETIHWTAGNFTWSGDIAAFTLFVGAVTFWLRQVSFQPSGQWLPRWGFLVCGAVLALHSISGLRIDAMYLTHYGCGFDYQGGFVCGR